MKTMNKSKSIRIVPNKFKYGSDQVKLNIFLYDFNLDQVKIEGFRLKIQTNMKQIRSN